MGYIAHTEVTTDKASQRVKTLLAALAYAVDYNAKKYSKSKEFEKPRQQLLKLKRELEESPAQEESGKVFQESLLKDINAQIQAAESGVQAIYAETLKNEAREDYALKSLAEEGFTDWKDRSFRVVSYGKDPEYAFKNENRENDGQPYWFIDNERLGRLFIEDFKSFLPKNIPEDAFMFECFESKTGTQRHGNVLLVSFNHAYEPEVREAFVKLTQKNLEALKVGKNLDVYESLEEKGKIKDAMDFDDAEFLGSYMPYQLETEASMKSSGRLTTEILHAEDPMARISEIPLQEQYPLLNIDRYAEQDSKLKSFLEDPFGGDIGRDEKGFRRAMQICLSHYLDEVGQSLNIQKVLSAVDREIDARSRTNSIEMAP